MGKAPRFNSSRNSPYNYKSGPSNRINLPDYVPLENYHKPVCRTVVDSNHKTYQKNSYSKARGSSERFRDQNQYEQNTKHSPITYKPRKFKEESPITLKVTLKKKNTLNNGYPEQTKPSAFTRLGDYPQQRPSPIIFDVNESASSSSRRSTTVRSSRNLTPPHDPRNVLQNPEPRMNLFIQTESSSDQSFSSMQPMAIPLRTNMPEESVIETLHRLEAKQKEIIVHCNGLRDTVDEYHREISKLEAIIYELSQEIEIIRRRIIK